MFCEYRKCQLHGFLEIALMWFHCSSDKECYVNCWWHSHYKVRKMVLQSVWFWCYVHIDFILLEMFVYKTVIFFDHCVKVKFCAYVCNVHQICVPVLDYGQWGRIVDPGSSRQTSRCHFHAHSPVQVLDHAVLCHSEDSCVLEHFHRSEGWCGAHSLICKIKRVIL